MARPGFIPTPVVPWLAAKRIVSGFKGSTNRPGRSAKSSVRFAEPAPAATAARGTPATGVHYPQNFFETPPGVGPYAMMLGAGQMINRYRATQQWFNALRQAAEEDKRDVRQAAQEAARAGGGGGGGGGGGRGGARYAPPPSGVDPQWYRQFQQEHGGQTPEEYYAQTGEDIGHALADEEWGRQFEREHGRAPSEYDWRHHWFMTRTGHPPPEGMEQWLREQEEGYGTGDNDQRPPTYQPSMIIWR